MPGESEANHTRNEFLSARGLLPLSSPAQPVSRAVGAAKPGASLDVEGGMARDLSSPERSAQERSIAEAIHAASNEDSRTVLQEFGAALLGHPIDVSTPGASSKVPPEPTEPPVLPFAAACTELSPAQVDLRRRLHQLASSLSSEASPSTPGRETGSVPGYTQPTHFFKRRASPQRISRRGLVSLHSPNGRGRGDQPAAARHWSPSGSGARSPEPRGSGHLQVGDPPQAVFASTSHCCCYSECAPMSIAGVTAELASLEGTG